MKKEFVEIRLSKNTVKLKLSEIRERCSDLTDELEKLEETGVFAKAAKKPPQEGLDRG